MNFFVVVRSTVLEAYTSGGGNEAQTPQGTPLTLF
jgi:hypothetical protein